VEYMAWDNKQQRPKMANVICGHNFEAKGDEANFASWCSNDERKSYIEMMSLSSSLSWLG
jgi:hypothetical protein